MNNLFKALTTKDTYTENGMLAHSTTSNPLLDMFFKIGATRHLSEVDIVDIFSKAFAYNPTLAVRCMFYNRDIRGGQGERRSFRVMLAWLTQNYPETAINIIKYVPEYGRWDDLFSTVGNSRVWKVATDFILFSLKAGDALCAKWMPRDNKKYREIANYLVETWGITPKQYRKLIAGNTNVVESLMCNGLWNKINYNSVPSKASNIYRNSFKRHDTERYNEWIDSLSKKDTTSKINAGAIFPHDIVKPYYDGKPLDRTLEEQWKALPDYVSEGVSFLPICDVSGSMSSYAVLDKAITLSIYLAERNKSIFKNGFMTFSGDAHFVQIHSKSLYAKVQEVRNTRITSMWESNTDLTNLFKVLLGHARDAEVSPSDMPDTLLILSDMQFDPSWYNRNQSAMEMIKESYERFGYKFPNIVFWNLRSSDNVPVKADTKGTILVSGYSPSIMKNVLSNEYTPVNMMLRVLNSDRYSKITL
jgi:hypothetical protein